MILIADSGSSKTDWLFINDNQLIKNIETPGINPFFQNTEEITKKLNSFFQNEIKRLVTNVYFYGAGCIKNKTDQTVVSALKNLFPSANIEVEDDMLGAARALFGKKEGIACILGTGSNSCRYDGNKITDKVPTLGYILGDEGSGAYLGKIFLNNYFKRIIPNDLVKKIDTDLKLKMTDVLSSVYKKEYPNRYLAGFSKFMSKNITHPYIHKLIKDGFKTFIRKNIQQYDHYNLLPVGFVGSIAYYYADILKEAAREENILIGKILDKPVSGIMEYHIKKA